jgi:hypothetical protein
MYLGSDDSGNGKGIWICFIFGKCWALVLPVDRRGQVGVVGVLTNHELIQVAWGFMGVRGIAGMPDPVENRWGFGGVISSGKTSSRMGEVSDALASIEEA